MADIFNPSYPTYFGFELMASTTRSDSINSATKYWAGMVRPTVSKTVTSLQFANWSHVGTFQTQNIELWTDSGGAPGTLLQATTKTPTANFTWNSATITSQAVTAGTAYWVVIYSANNSVANSIELRGVNDPDGLVSGVSNKFSVSISTNSGAAWSNQGSQWIGCVGLGYSDATYEGSGYGDFDTYNINNTNNQWGEYFQVPANMTVNAFSHKTYKNAAGTPTADLTYVLMNADTATTLASGTLVTAGTITTSATWYTASFSNVNLVTGTNYRVYITSAATASPQYTFLPPKTTGNGNSNAMTFGGTTDVLANNNSGTYQTDSTHEFPFRLTLVSSVNASVSQLAASVTASGGTQAIASVQKVSITQVAGTVTATGGTQASATVNNVAITQSAATVTAAGGTQVVNSMQNAAISQVAGTITASGGTQVAITVNIITITQTAATVTATGGTQLASATSGIVSGLTNFVMLVDGTPALIIASKQRQIVNLLDGRRALHIGNKLYLPL